MTTTGQEGHASVAVANQFIKVAHSKKKPLCSLTKLIKLVYIAHGYYLALKDKNLIQEEVQAWAFGPVIPVVHNTFRRVPPVPEPLPEAEHSGEPVKDTYTLEFIEAVHKGYGHLNYKEISELTHKKGTPWDIVYRRDGDKAKIENELIREYYSDLIESLAEDA